MRSFATVWISLLAGVIGWVGPVVAQSSRELGFVGTWRITSSNSDVSPTAEICGRECTITFDGKALSVKTGEETVSYIAGKATKKHIELSQGHIVDITILPE